MKLWIVGKFIGLFDEKRSAWEFQGVFDSEKAAESACISENYFMAEAELNVALSDESTEWKNLKYPKAK